jgi:DNA-binding CsgD family transcriptional regulator
MAKPTSSSPSVRSATTSALESAIERGDIDFIYQMFANTARDLAQTGQGKQLIKLSKYAGDQSAEGQALQKAFTLMGYLIELDFESAKVMALELEMEKNKTKIEDFLEKLIAYTRSFIYFNEGDLKKAKAQINIALTSKVLTTDLERIDKPSLLRNMAMIDHLFADLPQMQSAQKQVEDIVSESGGTNVAYHLIAIKTLNYYEEGNYIKANEFAKMGIASAEANGFIGITAPLDCKYMVARTLFEFSKLDNALIELDELKVEAERNKSLLFYVLAETFAIRILTAQSNISLALDRLNQLNEKIDSISKKTDLAWLIDVTELYIRFILNDAARCNILISRCPDLPYVRHVKTALTENSGGQSLTRSEVMQLPEGSYKEQIYKYMYLSEFRAESGKSPKYWMKKALNLGELTGNREIFIRQSDHHINLIIEITKEEPSYYLEELARDCIKRLKARSEASKAGSEGLTAREIDVLKHLASGKSLEAISKTLHISKNTMKTHLRNLYRKLGVTGRVEAVAKGQKLLLI